MNFFELQARARRRTWLLLLWMLVAVVGVTLAMNVAAWVIVSAADLVTLPRTGGDIETMLPEAGTNLDLWLQLPWWKWITAATLLALLGGTLVRYLTIARGGRAIADMIDARRVDLSTREEADRRFINVVEEMSIASGTPRPALYVMEQESAINAFVAGTRPNNAIMVVTRGALDRLGREQLQGVVGHEFSHILNGDMRLNLRLMAIVAGILMFGKVGVFMLRGVRTRRHDRSRREGFVGGGGGGRLMVAWFATGIALLLIGYVGLFCGRLIKAAVSRQREYLADASAVQFTRSTEGLSGALWQIAESSGGAVLDSAYAEDMSHMCFGQSVAIPFFADLLATHPPIEQRLAALDPQFRARRVAREVRQGARANTANDSAAPAAVQSPVVPAGAAGFAGAAPAAATHLSLAAGGVTASVGRPTPAHADYAHALYARIPEVVLDAAHQSPGAEALVYALLLEEVRGDRLTVAGALLEHQVGSATATLARELHPQVQALGEAARLPLFDLAVATLRDGDADERARIAAVSEKLARVDREVSVFEFALLALLRHHLASADNRSDRARFFSLAPVVGDLRRLLSLLARTGSDDEDQARAAFERATSGIAEGVLTLASVAQCDPARMHEGLERIALLSPLLKRPVLEACVDCVQHDGRVTLAESELLRAIAESLDCPLPPLLAGAAA